jgi:hypothetical protein
LFFRSLSEIARSYDGGSSSEVSPTQSSFDYHMSEQSSGYKGTPTNMMASADVQTRDISHHHSPTPPSPVHTGGQIQRSSNSSEIYVQQQDLSRRYNHHARSGSGSAGGGTPTTSSGSPVTTTSMESASSTGHNSRERRVEMQVSGRDQVVESRMNGD